MYFNRLLKSTIVLSILICTSFGLVSCSGVTQAEFDRISEDLNNAQSNAQKVSNKLAVSQSKLEDIESELETLQINVREARLVLEVFNEFLNIGLTGNTTNLLGLFGKLAEIENEEIRESVQYLMEYGDYISDDEAGMIVMGWLEEVETMLK